MSYLNPIRLHFAGRFRADVSTVNNEVSRYNNQTFSIPDNQKPFNGHGQNSNNNDDRSNWQPAGTGAWRLLDCRVKRHYRSDGTAASTPADDMVVGLAVREARDRASAKIVDLDPEQQLVSMIFGLTICLIDNQGQILLQGEFEPAAFFDLNSNRSAGRGDAGRSAYFQSVLTNVTWGDVAPSPCLTQLKRASAAKMLSIRFITDGYKMNDPQRGYGQIVGTIGPYFDGEPHTFILGRHLEVKPAVPRARYVQADCRVDTARRKVLIDAGNILKVEPGGDFSDFSDIGDITLTAGGVNLGALNYKGAGSYANTAGIYELPPDRQLAAAELAAIARQPLQLMLHAPAAAPSAFASERSDGIYSRPERFVFRLDAGTSASTDLIVTRFGVPFPNATPATTPFLLSQSDNDPPPPQLAIAAKTDNAGRARLTITAVDPGKPRDAVDGQVYGVFCSVQESQTDQKITFAEGNFISVLVFGAVTAPASPGWEDVRQIFKQYADLYPRPHGPDPYAPFDGLPPSHPVVNLDDYDAVASFARRIQKALELPIEDPNHMPVTRDLSGAKRKLLLTWLRNVGPDGKPKKDRTPTGHAPTFAAVAASAARSAANYPKMDVESLRHQPPSSER